MHNSTVLSIIHPPSTITSTIIHECRCLWVMLLGVPSLWGMCRGQSGLQSRFYLFIYLFSSADISSNSFSCRLFILGLCANPNDFFPSSVTGCTDTLATMHEEWQTTQHCRLLAQSPTETRAHGPENWGGPHPIMRHRIDAGRSNTLF